MEGWKLLIKITQDIDLVKNVIQTFKSIYHTVCQLYAMWSWMLPESNVLIRMLPERK